MIDQYVLDTCVGLM